MLNLPPSPGHAGVARLVAALIALLPAQIAAEQCYPVARTSPKEVVIGGGLGVDWLVVAVSLMIILSFALGILCGLACRPGRRDKEPEVRTPTEKKAVQTRTVMTMSPATYTQVRKVVTPRFLPLPAGADGAWPE